MTTADSDRICPHCGGRLVAMALPDQGGWDHEYDLVCFDDACPYFRSGWTWMLDHFGVHSSYRFRRNPVNGHESPLAVWSATALRSRILEP